jgi:hypothetical protein
MCRICEGFSLDDVLALDAARIAEYGFAIIGVSGDPAEEHPRSWAYTVGLLDAADHPELIVAGIKPDTAGALLSDLGHAVIDEGARFEIGDTIDVGCGIARIGAVNEIQYGLSTFNMWHNLQRYGTLLTSALEAVQVIMPSSLFCSVHSGSQPLLHLPGTRIDAPPRSANRAERRRRGFKP